MDNLTNYNNKGDLFQVIDIDIRGTIDLEEGVFLTLNIGIFTIKLTMDNITLTGKE